MIGKILFKYVIFFSSFSLKYIPIINAVALLHLNDLIMELKEKEIPVLGTKVEFGEDIRNLTPRDKEKFALIMGNEGRGVNPEILALCDKYIYIELNSDVESLNVAIAASILLYELSRRD